MLSLAFLTLSCGKNGENITVQGQVIEVSSHPKNIIMVVGDGMGPAYTTAYRLFKDDLNTEQVENTVFDRNMVGISSTHPDTNHPYVTDSAASATALASGIKTHNGAIGVDIHKKPVETVLERAKSLGKKTGIVVTSQINHATPAAYLSHNESRHNYNEIADSYIDQGIKADVYLGGGWKYFLREKRNLVEEFINNDFSYVDNYDSLSQAPINKPLLGLFGKKGLPWAIDDTNKHRLSTMTRKAIQHLENDDGFFLLVEASQIDWGGHANDIATAITEMDDLAKTLEYLEAYVESYPDTLVIVTADHSTGGLSVGANGLYAWKPNILKAMNKSPISIAKALKKQDITKDTTHALFNFSLTDEELNRLITVKNVIQTKLQIAELTDSNPSKKLNIKDELYKEIKSIINKRTNTGWTSGGHTAVDVQVFAMGNNKHLFNGFQDNTDIGKKIFALLGR